MRDSECNQICEGQFGDWLRAKITRGGKVGGKLVVTERDGKKFTGGVIGGQDTERKLPDLDKVQSQADTQQQVIEKVAGETNSELKNPNDQRLEVGDEEGQHKGQKLAIQPMVSEAEPSLCNAFTSVECQSNGKKKSAS